jgi:hypothetical protein
MAEHRILLIVAVLQLSTSLLVDAGCVQSGFCCDGKNVTCRGEGPRMNNPRSRSCFCDSHCLQGRDCCIDYHEACERAALAARVVDCELGQWLPWSECDARCGQGIKQRRREVIVEERNGGQPCGPTVEKAICEGTGCKVPRAPEGQADLKETGKIIPAMFGTWRKSKRYDPYKDIRKNLFEHYEPHKMVNQPSPYCAHFQLTETRPSCRKSPLGEWPKLLVPGATVCVECQPMVMNGQLGGRCRGHGVLNRETRWDAVIVPGCHGKWIMTTAHETCQCNPEDPLSFVLV